eukprot:14481778-Alexandrium_andersonii.AAC.1
MSFLQTLPVIAARARLVAHVLGCAWTQLLGRGRGLIDRAGADTEIRFQRSQLSSLNFSARAPGELDTSTCH